MSLFTEINRGVYREYRRQEKRSLASQLRSGPTASESAFQEAMDKLLPKAYRSSESKALFKYQVPVLGFIADAFCGRALLVVEIDGSYHNAKHQVAADARRDKAMSSRKYRVVRIKADEVMSDASSVAKRIRDDALQYCDDKVRAAIAADDAYRAAYPAAD